MSCACENLKALLTFLTRALLNRAIEEHESPLSLLSLFILLCFSLASYFFLSSREIKISVQKVAIALVNVCGCVCVCTCSFFIVSSDVLICARALKQTSNCHIALSPIKPSRAKIIKRSCALISSPGSILQISKLIWYRSP